MWFKLQLHGSACVFVYLRTDRSNSPGHDHHVRHPRPFRPTRLPVVPLPLFPMTSRHHRRITQGCTPVCRDQDYVTAFRTLSKELNRFHDFETTVITQYERQTDSYVPVSIDIKYKGQQSGSGLDTTALVANAKREVKERIDQVISEKQKIRAELGGKLNMQNEIYIRGDDGVYWVQYSNQPTPRTFAQRLADEVSR